MVQAGPQSSGRRSCSASSVWYAPFKGKGESCRCHAKVRVSVCTIFCISVPKNFGTLLSKQDHLAICIWSASGNLKHLLQPTRKQKHSDSPWFCPGNVRCFDVQTTSPEDLLIEQWRCDKLILHINRIDRWVSTGTATSIIVVMIENWKRVESKHKRRCCFCQLVPTKVSTACLSLHSMERRVCLGESTLPRVLHALSCVTAEFRVRLKRPQDGRKIQKNGDNMRKLTSEALTVGTTHCWSGGRVGVRTCYQNPHSLPRDICEVFEGWRGIVGAGIFSILSMMHNPGPSKFVARCIRLSAGPHKCKEPFWNLKM